MAVKIRLARKGRRNAPFYRLVASESRFARDGRNIQSLGTYNPQTKELNVNRELLEKFVNNGAILSDTVARLVKKEA